MRHLIRYLVLAVPLVAASCAGAGQQFATITNFETDSGHVVERCVVGYRTYGTMNADKSNVIILPTWFGGTTADYESFGKVGPGALADSSRYFVITIDSLGNGVSCSPSNSKLINGAAFQQITIADMVRAQYEFLMRQMKIDRVHAVIGISMSGMQGFRWLEMYPEFMRKVVIVDGSPRVTSYDLLQWRTQKEIGLAMREGGFSDVEIGGVMSRLHYLTLFTPAYFVETVPVDQLDEFLAPTFKPNPDFRLDNYMAQLDAIMSHSVIGYDAESLQRYASAIKAEVLIVGTASDHMVNPIPARRLAPHIGAEYLSIDSNCGHVGSSCEQAIVNKHVATFLAD